MGQYSVEDLCSWEAHHIDVAFNIIVFVVFY